MLLETLFCTVLGVGVNTGPGDLAVSMNHKRYRDWTIELPQETFTAVGQAIHLADGKYSFAVGAEGSNLLLDLDGDGQTDVRITGSEGSALLRHADGFRYAIRLKHDPNGWSFASSGAQVGKLDGTRIALIDQNNDGIFNQVGTDAILIGQGKIATWLGTTVLIDGKVHSLKLGADGAQMELAAYQGETGSLSVAEGFHGKGKILSAVLSSLDNKHCFDLAGLEGPVQVPVGQYRIRSGKIGLGELAVMVAPGDAARLDVVAGGKQKLEWGGPVRAEFKFERGNGLIGFSPDQVWYFGSGGEEYLQWRPVGKSPVFTIVDRITKSEVARTVFPGSG
jgi:hypothetical protein